MQATSEICIQVSDNQKAAAERPAGYSVGCHRITAWPPAAVAAGAPVLVDLIAQELSTDDAKTLLALCASGRLYAIEAWVQTGRSLQVPTRA